MRKDSIDYDKGNDLLKQIKSNGITHNAKDKRHQVTLDFQDFIGQATPNQTTKFYESLDQENRRLFIFAATATLHHETAIDVIKSTTIAVERKTLYMDFDIYCSEQCDKIQKEMDTLNACKKPIYKHIAKLESKIRGFKSNIDRKQLRIIELTAEADKSYKRALQNEHARAAFNLVKESFQNISNQLAD